MMAAPWRGINGSTWYPPDGSTRRGMASIPCSDTLPGHGKSSDNLTKQPAARIARNHRPRHSKADAGYPEDLRP